MEKHMNRKELIEASQKGSLPKSGHLAGCPECQEAVRLLKAFPVFDNTPLENAPQHLVNKAIAIIKESGIVHKLAKLKARLVFDSWAMAQPVGVRGINSISDRRLRFVSEDISFDLRAEKSAAEWIFTARASGKDIDRDTFTLKAGKKELRADESGIFEWKMGRPPRKIVLEGETCSIELPELSWMKKTT